jgi:tRNA 5-methylaminomethyl-2-thiouridine biosynthesis bifunctional protein
MSSAHLDKFDSVKPAVIEWRNELPFSTEFDDVYFSAEGGVKESDHVFIQGTELVHDWNTKPQQSFSIAELGFGTGLNFVNTAHHWQQYLSETDGQKKLHYISIEKRPLLIADLKRALNFWPQFEGIANTLFNHYPSPSYGRFQIRFPELNIYLTLLFMPVENALEDLLTESQSRTPKLNIDHWFLDGFAPAKNESMWLENVFEKIASLSKSGTKLATFSVAAAVKKPLSRLGFEIKKRKGFASKREMLTAIYSEEKNSPRNSQYINLKYDRPWFNIAQTIDERSFFNKHKIAIIGGGIAGCTLAYTLTNEDYSVVLYETEPSVACKASGAAAGIFHPQLTSDLNLSSQFNWQAYLCLINWLALQPTKIRERLFLSDGLERFLKDKKSKNELLHLAKKYHLSQWITNSPTDTQSATSIYFPDAGAIDIKALCAFYTEQALSRGLVLKTNKRVENIEPSNDCWIITANNQTSHYQHVVYCGGAETTLMNRFNTIPTNTSRGQTCYFQDQGLLQRLNHTVCEQVYLVPSPPNHLHIGSTFESFVDERINRTSQSDMLNRASIFLKQNQLGELTESSIKNSPLSGTVGYRLHSKDRLPLVGSAFNEKKLVNDFDQLGQKKIERLAVSSYNQPGAWFNTAYGSHGLIYSLLCSQHLSSLINNHYSPLSSNLSNAINPARFFIKSLKG